MANAQMASLWFFGRVGSCSYGTSQSSAHWRTLMWPWRPGSICYSGDGGIQQNCQVCWSWTHVWLPFPADYGGVSWPCQWVSYSLPHGAWKENSPTDRRPAWDCFSVSKSLGILDTEGIKIIIIKIIKPINMTTAAYSDQTFPWTICRSVRRTVQCIVEKRRIGPGCRLAS